MSSTRISSALDVKGSIAADTWYLREAITPARACRVATPCASRVCATWQLSGWLKSCKNALDNGLTTLTCRKRASCVTCGTASTAWVSRPATHASRKLRGSLALGTTSRGFLLRHSCPCQRRVMASSKRRLGSDLSITQRHLARCAKNGTSGEVVGSGGRDGWGEARGGGAR